jgi:nicotinamidase-related amidase
VKSAVLVIDVQNQFFSVTPPYDAHGVIERINRATELARKLGLPIVFVTARNCRLTAELRALAASSRIGRCADGQFHPQDHAGLFPSH